jgi:hypothetical protein
LTKFQDFSISKIPSAIDSEQGAGGKKGGAGGVRQLLVGQWIWWFGVPWCLFFFFLLLLFFFVCARV